MVMIYRTPGIAASGTKPYLQINNTELPARLARGGFYSYAAPAGPLLVSHSSGSSGAKPLTRDRAEMGATLVAGLINLSNGVRSNGMVDLSPLSLGGGLVADAMSTDVLSRRQNSMTLQVVPGEMYYLIMGRIDRPLTVVPREEAEEEITGCRWLNPPAK